MASVITLGCSQISFGVAAPDGNFPVSVAKMGKLTKETCKITQDKSEVTEHFEEGKATPLARVKQKKIPVVTFSISDADPQFLADYVGGTVVNGKWGFDGSELVVNRAIRITPEQGMTIEIPNADIDAVINADMSKKGLFQVDFTVTPMAVTANKSIYAYQQGTLTVAPLSLSFTAAADTTGQTITATSTGNVTYAGKDSQEEWLTVTRSGKVVTVKVSANTNSESRTAYLTIVADGNSAVVPVTQAGA